MSLRPALRAAVYEPTALSSLYASTPSMSEYFPSSPLMACRPPGMSSVGLSCSPITCSPNFFAQKR
jgi:hypothetical protein